jgi:putative Mn2+ efflux pump MntP
MPLKLLALIVPLSLDTFAVSAAIGVAGLSRRERLRLSLLMSGFEMGMPVVGFTVGRVLGGAVGGAADYMAVAILAAVGIVMLRDDDAELGENDLRTRSRGVAAIGLGISVSLDELAIGVTIGLVALPVVLVIALIGVQGFVASQLGCRLGGRLSACLRERAERLAGSILVALAAVLLALKLSGHG